MWAVGSQAMGCLSAPAACSAVPSMLCGCVSRRLWLPRRFALGLSRPSAGKSIQCVQETAPALQQQGRAGLLLQDCNVANVLRRGSV